jgi:hypothetical protein
MLKPPGKLQRAKSVFTVPRPIILMIAGNDEYYSQSSREDRRSIPRSIYEEARDVARALAKTEAFDRSRRDRKRVEVLFAHLKRIFPAGSSALARTMRCPVRVHSGGNRAKPPQARKACRTTTAGRKSMLCVNGAEFGSIGSLTIPCQVIGWQASSSRNSH